MRWLAVPQGPSRASSGSRRPYSLHVPADGTFAFRDHLRPCPGGAGRRVLQTSLELHMTPVETVRHIYAAFGRGDIPAILACLAEGVEWEYGAYPNPVPWLQPRKGHAGAQAFFESLAAVEFNDFRPLKVFGDHETVLGLVHLEATVRATGKRVVEPAEVHVFHFNDRGQVQRFRHAADTWQHAMALRKD